MRAKVFACFRALHRARKVVFAGDEYALQLGKQKIRDEFAKHKSETDPEKIAECIKLAEDAEKALRTMVVQAVKQDNGKYKVRITEDTHLGINPAFPPEHPTGKTS